MRRIQSGQHYDYLGFLRGDEKGVCGPVMVERAKGMGAHLGKEDGEHFLEHQCDIPAELEGKVVFVFTDWRSNIDPERICYICWSGRHRQWVVRWRWINSIWSGYFHLPRPKNHTWEEGSPGPSC